MKINKHIQKKIDLYAQKRLHHLQAKTFPFEIINCIIDFRTDLANNNIIIEDFEDKEITHIPKIPIDPDLYFQTKNIIQFSSMYLGTEYCYVQNNESHINGIIFIGHINNIYATQILFDCLRKIATEIRQTYMTKLKRYKKQSTKDERADEYINEWFDGLIENVRYNSWYDSSDRKCFSDYVKKHFKMMDDVVYFMLRILEIIKPVLDVKDKTITWGEFKKELSKSFPEEDINEKIKEFKDIRKKDLVINFSVEESINKIYD
jgi:hypothetical protein